MGANCVPLVADLFLFCYERDFMKSLSRENQADIIEAFDSTSRYLDDLLHIDNIPDKKKKKKKKRIQYSLKNYNQLRIVDKIFIHERNLF